LNKLNLLPIRQALFAVIAACVFSACTTEPAQLGLNLTPQGDKLNAYFTDTSTVVAFNNPIDTLRTSVLPGYVGTNSVTMLCGSMYDSTYGKLEASFATQLWLSTINPTIGTNPVADSVIIQLPYAGLFGDSLSSQTLKVYELTEPLRGDSVYYSNRIITGNPSSLISSTTFVPNAKDSVTLRGVKYGPMLRLKLNNSFGDKIINGGTNLVTQENFRHFINGLYFTTTPKDVLGQGSVLTFTIAGTNTGIEIYYHTDAGKDSLNVYVDASNSQRYNTFNFHNYQYADPLFKAQFIAKDSTKGQQKLFLSGMSASEIKIRFPYILKYKEKHRAGFNQAILVVEAPYATNTIYPPTQLTLYQVYKDGTRTALGDLASGVPAAIAGTYDSTLKQYRFKVTQYLQNILSTGKEDYYLMLGTYTPGKIASNVVIPGTKAGKKRIRLELIYTALK
jgi:hypothetical protein